MSKLWEVDPETRAKLSEIQKQNGNNVCIDCGAPSPQWVRYTHITTSLNLGMLETALTKTIDQLTPGITETRPLHVPQLLWDPPRPRRPRLLRPQRHHGRLQSRRGQAHAARRQHSLQDFFRQP